MSDRQELSLRISQDMTFEEYVHDELVEIKADVKAIVLALNGNGHKGLKQIVQEHTTYFKVIGATLVASIPIGLFVAPHIVIR